MDKIEQYIIDKCVENDPSIMELRFGTKVIHHDETRTIIHHTKSWYSFLGEDGLIGSENEQDFEILGRDIYHHDVLGAIERKFESLLDKDSWNCDVGSYQVADVLKVWNLKKPLHEQEEDTKLFLAKILGFVK